MNKNETFPPSFLVYVRDRASLGLITHRLPQEMAVPGGRKAGLAWTAIEKDTFSDFVLLSSEII